MVAAVKHRSVLYRRNGSAARKSSISLSIQTLLPPMTRARGNRFSCIIFQIVGKLSGTRLRSSVLGISRIGGGAISGLMGWSSGLAAGGLRPSAAVARVLWREEVDAWHVMRDPRQRTTDRPSMCSDQGSHRAANGGRLYGRSARWSKECSLPIGGN